MRSAPASIARRRCFRPGLFWPPALALNACLPADIRISDCQPSSKAYQPNRSSVSKEYHYYFTAAAVDNVATHDIAQHLPMMATTAQALQQLRTACQLFVGQQDFYNFCQRDNSAPHCIREIFYCDIETANFGAAVGSG